MASRATTRNVLPGKPRLSTDLRAAFSICWRRNGRTMDLYLTLGDAVIASLRSGQFETMAIGTAVLIFGLSSKQGGASSLTLGRTSVSIFEISSEMALRVRLDAGIDRVSGTSLPTYERF